MRRLPSIVIVVIALVVGLWVGRATSDSPASPSTTAPAPQHTPTRVRVVERSGDTRELRSQMRALLNRLDDSSAHRRSRGGGTAAANQPAPSRSQVQLDGWDDGEALVDGAVSRGTWTAADRQAFVKLLPVLRRDDRRKLLGRLVVAINNGDVSPDEVEFLSPLPPKHR